MFIECRHILPRGTKCKAAALRGRPYCYFHDQLHTYRQDGTRDGKDPLRLPSIEDASGIQLALTQVMNAMANGRLDSREGVRLIYGLQVALQAFAQVPKTPPQEIVQATACDGIGIDIADEEAGLCEPHTGCPTCTKRFGCDNIARQNKKSLRHLVDEARDRRERAEREPLALPASGTSAPTLPLPTPGTESSLNAPAHAIDKQKEADLEARINKFRPNKREADRIARAREIARMVADHEITIDEVLDLPPDAPPQPQLRAARRRDLNHT